MPGQNEEVDLVTTVRNNTKCVVAFGDNVDANTRIGNAIAFGQNRSARVEVSGTAIIFGGGTAQADTAVTLAKSLGKAFARHIAVALNQKGLAVGRDIALADELKSEAHSQTIAIAIGTLGVADGLMSIALGRGGVAVAREGGIIALARYGEKQPGHWESAHGCDPTWFDGEVYLSDLKVAKVGTNGIRANYRYRLDDDGSFLEVGPATERKRYDKPEGSL